MPGAAPRPRLASGILPAAILLLVRGGQSARVAAGGEPLGGNKPVFDAGTFKGLIRVLQDNPVGECGGPLLAVASTKSFVNNAVRTKSIANRVLEFFRLRGAEAAWEDAARLKPYAHGDPSTMPAPRWDGPSMFSTFHTEEIFGVPAGLRLVGVQVKRLSGEDVDSEHNRGYWNVISPSNVVGAINSMSQADVYVDFSFDAGVDLRDCWGDLVDLDGRPVCGDEIMAELRRGIEEMDEVETDSAGQSGSTIVTGLDKFILKTTGNPEEYQLIQEAFPAFKARTETNRAKFGGCWSTGLAPFCAAVVDPGSAVWLITRKVALPKDGFRKYEMDVRNPRDPGKGAEQVAWFDLKSPKFATYLRDGKTNLDYHLALGAAGWQHKDAGFTTFFPEGLPLDQCGSRDATVSLLATAEMLKDEKMTDYSLFAAAFVAAGEASVPSCSCNTAGKPTFPIVMWVPERLSYGHDEKIAIPRRFAFAVGIIDYVEQTVRLPPFDTLSTMKPPEDYMPLFARQFTHYFKLPEVFADVVPEQGPGPGPGSSAVLKPDGHGPGPFEEIRVGSQVRTLNKIKWWDKMWDESNADDWSLPAPPPSYNTRFTRYYTTQAVEHSSFNTIGKVDPARNLFSYFYTPGDDRDKVRGYNKKVEAWTAGTVHAVNGCCALVAFPHKPRYLFWVQHSQIVGDPRPWTTL